MTATTSGKPNGRPKVGIFGLTGCAGDQLQILNCEDELVRLSQRLETLQRDTRDIVESLNSALLVVDLEGRIQYANPAAEAILGGTVGRYGFLRGEIDWNRVLRPGALALRW